MRNRALIRLPLLSAAILVLLGNAGPARAGSPAPPFDRSRIEETLRILTSDESRMPGSVGSSNAFEHIRAELGEILGTNRVVVQEFDVTVPVPDAPGRLQVGGMDLEVDALWPNAGVPPKTPREGIEGPLIYAGSYEDLDGTDVEGGILVQDFADGDFWVRVAGLGIRAVVFLPPRVVERTEMERALLSAPLDYPRFMLRRADRAEELRQAARRGERARLWGGSHWETVTAHNVIGLLPGSDPDHANERVILSAYYDAVSVVPNRAPGAEAAGNAAALLETARQFAEDPPARTVLFVFTDAHFLGMSGAANFIRWFSEANTNGGHHRKLLAIPLEEKMLRARLPDFERLAREFPTLEAITNLYADVRESLESKSEEEEKVRREIEVLAVPPFSTEWDRANAYVETYEGVRNAFRDMGDLKGALADLRTRIRDLRNDPELRNRPGAAEEIALCRKAREAIVRLQKKYEHTPELDRLVKEARKNRPRAPLFRRVSERERARKRSPVLFVGFDLTSGSPKVGLFIRGGYEDNRDIYRQREYVPLGRALRSRIIGDAEMGQPGLGDALGVPAAAIFAETITGQRGTSAESFFSETFAFESEIVSMAIPAVTVATCEDARRLVDTPEDTVEQVNLDNLLLGGRMAATICRMLADDVDIDLHIYEKFRLYPAIHGRAVRLEQAKSLIADTPVPGALLMVRPERGMKGAYLRGFPKPLYGIHTEHVTIADEDGGFSFPGFLWTAGAELQAFLLDEETGHVTMAHDLGGEGDRKYNFHRIHIPSRSALGITAVLFDCSATALVDLVDPRYLLSLQYLQILDGRTDAEPQFFGFSLPMVPRYATSYIEPCVVIFTRPDDRFKLTMSLGLVGKRLVLVNAATPLIELGYAVRGCLDRAESGPDALARAPASLQPKTVEELFSKILDADPEELLSRGIVPPTEKELRHLREARETFRTLVEEARNGGTDHAWRKRRQEVERLVSTVIENHKGSTYGFRPVHGVMKEVPERVARDLWYLNEERLAALTRHGIVSEFLAGMHREARAALDRAANYRKDRLWSRYVEATSDAWAFASRVYPDVISTSNDVVRGVIFYLAMALPFAFFTERLVFAFADIRARIAGVVGVFAVVLLLLAMVHPAFAITMTPLLIFLGFVIITLAVVVTSLVMSKFNRELRRLKSGMVALRYSDVNRFGAALTAFNLGVSYMRRRKMKTTLTCVALILLTFTVISFVSVQGYLRMNRYPLPWKAEYRGVLYRNLDWAPLEEPEFRRFRRAFEEGFVVAARAWLTAARPEEYLAMEISNADEPTRMTQIAGAVGLEPEEIRITGVGRALTAGRWFEPGDRKVCILPDSLAEAIGITPDRLGTAAVRLFGERLTVIGLVRSQPEEGLPGWNDIVDLNDDPLTPASFLVRRAEQVRRDEETGTTAAALEEYDYFPASAVALLPFKTLMMRGGTVRSIAARPLDESMDLRGFVEKLLSGWSLAIYVGEKPGETAMLFNSIGASSLSGLGTMAIPLLIAGLIIFNTMLGSVYERQKEIHTYSSVGLSPVHISSLFIAESCVYAVLGAIAGYLLGQAVAFTLAKNHWLAGLTLNYSSMSTFLAVAMVMLVTIGSSLYPASLAHRLATPDIARTWQVGDPEGDRWILDLPFIIDENQVHPFNAYLVDYFRAHREEAVGHFCAENVRFRDDIEEGLAVISFRCRLAPYDFGVQQDVELISLPSDVIEGKLTFRLAIRRISGEETAWRRTNREFFNRLRKTILLWRVLPDKEKDIYYSRTEDILSGKIEEEEA